MGPEADKAIAGPPPDNDTTCGAPEASSAIVNEPVREPVATGTKVMLTEHEAPLLKLAVQFVVSAKSADTSIWLIASGQVPLLVSVTV